MDHLIDYKACFTPNGPQGNGQDNHGYDGKDGFKEVAEQREMKIHPYAEILPPMSDEEFEALVLDVKCNNLQEEIVTLKGEILDGRNRDRACEQAGVKPRYREWNGECGSPMAFVITKNLHRRQLSSGQRALAAAEVKPLFEKEAKARQRMGQAKLPEAEKGQSREKAAQIFGVSPRSVTSAEKVLVKGIPELKEAVKTGKMAVSRAAKIAEKTSEEQRLILKRIAAPAQKRSEPNCKPKRQLDSWAAQALANATLGDVTWVILCHGDKPDVDTLIRLNGDLLARPNGKPSQDPSESLGFHLAHNGRWKHFRKCADNTGKDLNRKLKAHGDKYPEEETPASPDSSEIGANGPDGVAQYPTWILPTRFLTKDDGDVDISALYGDRNGRIAHVIATYMDGTTNLVEPIYMMKNQNFPFISDEWGPTALSLIQGDPLIVRLMVFDETGKFVVESTAMNSNVVDTRWVTPPAQSWD